MKLESDLTFSLADYVELDTDSAGPASVVDRVLQRIRAAYPRSVSRSDLAADPLCGGSVAGIRKATQRLVSRGLIQVVGKSPSKGGGSPSPEYQAIISREKSKNVCPTGTKVSQGLESTAGQPDSVSSCGELGTSQLDTPSTCPTDKPSRTDSFGPVGQVLEVPPKEERSMEQINEMLRRADIWG